MGRNWKRAVSNVPRSGAKPEVTWPRPQQQVGARASRSVSPAPATLILGNQPSGFPEADSGSRKPKQCGGRAPTLPRGATTTESECTVKQCLPAGRPRELLSSGTAGRTQEPGMEALTRLVSESLARHGFDRPLDYRRLHWSRWFRCESHHSLLSSPANPASSPWPKKSWISARAALGAR